ncbi:translation initiation factor IF-3, mitochondrial [Drosophila mauritiana]|uniref:Translation initiation factor IF-3, mitochondrial n=1 Tax=Drosophila mauritiana TaxID=7226 RepID=A0A6P8K103_DROMA|nr:translation initiation factor IF-3, mitochondrial [Drosophila mauritiana]
MQRFRLMLNHTAAAAIHQQPLRPFSVHWSLAQHQKPVGGSPGERRTRDTRSLKASVQKITLIQQNQSMSITTLEEAQKLAKRRELHLLRLEQTDAKTGRAMFKLVTAAEMLSDDAEQSRSASEKVKDKKSEKSLTIGARITEHDLSSRLKNIVKWLGKRHEVRILIQGNASGSDESSAERIVKAIEQTIKEPQLIGRIVQRHSKSAFIKFSIIPVAPPPVPVSTATPNPIQS